MLLSLFEFHDGGLALLALCVLLDDVDGDLEGFLLYSLELLVEATLLLALR